MSSSDLPRPRVMLVDDEPNVLQALRRALRPCGFELVLAEGGSQALELLRQAPVDAIVCDMRMPGLDGAQTLREARSLLPDAVRILLTGHADLQSLSAAVNEGEVFRYLSKPWEDALLVQTLQDGLARQSLERERDALRALTARQNEELQALNTGLEATVAQRTEALRQALDRQAELAQQLKQDFSQTVRLLSSLIEARAGLTAACTRSMAQHARLLAKRLGLAADAANDLLFAALLFDIGKLHLSDELLRKPLAALNGEQRKQWLRHPQIGESSLQALPSLSGSAQVLGAVYENFDGTGLPQHRKGNGIPRGARVLRVIADFEHGMAGALDMQRLSQQQAFARLRDGRGRVYDPEVVDAFLAEMNQPQQTSSPPVLLSSDQLLAGMVLAKDLMAKSGTLLLAQGHAVDERVIAHIRRLEEFTGDFLWISVTKESQQKAQASL